MSTSLRKALLIMIILTAHVTARVVRDVECHLPDNYPVELKPPPTDHWFLCTRSDETESGQDTYVRFISNSNLDALTRFFTGAENWDVVYSSAHSSPGYQRVIALDNTSSSQNLQAVIEISQSREEGDLLEEPYGPNTLTIFDIRYGSGVELAYPVYFSIRPILDIEGAVDAWLPGDFPKELIYPDAILDYGDQMTAREPETSIRFTSRDSVTKILAFFESFDDDGWEHEESTDSDPPDDFDSYTIYLSTTAGLKVRVQILPVMEEDESKNTKIIVTYDPSKPKPKENQ